MNDQVQPDIAQSLFVSAQAAQSQQQWQKAIQDYRACLEASTCHYAARFNLSQTLLASGAVEPAIKELEQLIAQQPEEAYWVEVLADAYERSGLVEQAIRIMKQALLRVSEPAALLSRLSGYLQASSCLYDAIAYGHWAVQQAPKEWTYRFNLANSYLIAGDAQTASDYLVSIIEHCDDTAQLDPAVWRLYGDSLTRLHHYIEAIDAYQQIPDWNTQPVLLNALGVACYESAYLDQAEECFLQAIALNPGYLNAHYHLANTWNAQGNHNRALDRYRELLKHKPNWPETQLNLALCLLSTNQWAEGFIRYGARWLVSDYQHEALSTSLPSLNTTLEIRMLSADDHILVWSEQGIGDELMFFRFCEPLLNTLSKMNTQVTLMLNKRLLPLVHRTYPNWKIRERVTELTNQDESIYTHQVPLGDLPKLLSIDHIEPSQAYLIVDSVQDQALTQSHDAQLTVGISWRGGRGQQQSLRSIPISDWAGLTKNRAIRWVSVQYGITDAEKAEWNQVLPGRLHIEDSVNALQDMDRFAAQLATLDLVISVDNSTVHLAGALGVPTWVLLPDCPEWRWPRPSNETKARAANVSSDWYDSVQLFHKHSASWQDVLKRVEAALSTRCSFS